MRELPGGSKLKIYSSLPRGKFAFEPISPGKVGIYVCGMTVYDFCHVGHARVMVVFDVVKRWLAASGFQVTYVRNITDIDDKIILRAAQENVPVEVLTNRFIRAMDDDAAALNILKPDIEPRATENVPRMVTLIQQLIDKGIAYRAPNGDVFYSVREFKGYGKLSGKNLDDLRAGERIEVDSSKRDPLDFVLWKSAKPGEPSWDSPWGRGRPGWHIECSAMSERYLGEHFDIHGGGQDLQFPHHENEIAQSEGAHGHIFVNYWMHNGFVRVDDEKMSKSLGNFFTVREVLAKYDAEVVRFFIARAHYRSPLNYSDQHLDDAKAALARLYTALKAVPAEPLVIDWDQPHAARFRDAMDDDFNTPDAIAVLFDLANEINRSRSRSAAVQLKSLAGLLGLLQRDPEDFLQSTVGEFDPTAIERLIAERVAARKARNFAESDRIRDELLADGIVLEDGPTGTTWRRH
ncbi:MAG TPA: cysteine--tRNA ligase [Burkholderiales bacterium]|nr:cysteine--tRNA ligase [Burkholderiales bacterium]